MILTGAQWEAIHTPEGDADDVVEHDDITYSRIGRVIIASWQWNGLGTEGPGFHIYRTVEDATNVMDTYREGGD